MTVKIITGNALTRLRELPDESVHCCVVSPPYWGLRDYGVAGQIGLEATPDAFVAEMVAVFREVRRVLRDDGTLWLNLGDSYCSTDKWGGGGNIGKNTVAPDGSVPSWAVRTKRPHMPGIKPKDLIGVPWRVAFALQAPDYLGRITKEADRAWLAALIDGEGCISILETTSSRQSGPVSTSYPPILQVRMCDPECIQKAMYLVGSESENPAQYPPSMAGHRPAYQWRIHGRKAADTIAEIYPFLLIKRKQAIVAWNAQASREGYETKRGVKVPVEASEKQKLCREIIQKLNQRESVDLPSWMIEPPQPIGPGWYLRQDVIWHKPNPMPESTEDRCTKAHEYIFLMTKSARYFYDADAIAEPASDNAHPRGTKLLHPKSRPDDSLARAKDSWHLSTSAVMATRNKRSVWTVATQPFPEAHFATFPPALIEPCIKAGTSERGCCVTCGTPWERVTGKVDTGRTQKMPDGMATYAGGHTTIHRDGREKGESGNPVLETVTLGWWPACRCEGLRELPPHPKKPSRVESESEDVYKRAIKRWLIECGRVDNERRMLCEAQASRKTVPAVVLDPFGGAGTTGLVADRLQRDAVLIELNPEYAAMARRRIDDDHGPLFARAAE